MVSRSIETVSRPPLMDIRNVLSERESSGKRPSYRGSLNRTVQANKKSRTNAKQDERQIVSRMFSVILSHEGRLQCSIEVFNHPIGRGMVRSSSDSLASKKFAHRFEKYSLELCQSVGCQISRRFEARNPVFKKAVTIFTSCGNPWTWATGRLNPHERC